MSIESAPTQSRAEETATAAADQKVTTTAQATGVEFDKVASTKGTTRVEHAEFIVDAVLFDMDGTLVDSIAAVEAAWSSVADEIGMDAQEVIDATHGRRAIDNLQDLKPQLRRLSNVEMEPHVETFEKKILAHADEYNQEVRSRRASAASERMEKIQSRRNSRSSSSSASRKNSFASGLAGLSALSFTKPPSPPAGSVEKKPSGTDTPDSGVDVGLDKKLNKLSLTERYGMNESAFADDEDDEVDVDEEDVDPEGKDIEVDTSDLTNKSVKILPGVRRMIDSIPKGRYAVATSGAKTYCHGALSRVGITPPEVTVTADDRRLKRGKPHPDPFILAAEDLGYDPKNCLVVEDSPSGIKAGVASGAKTIAVCTSHPVEKINDKGAHYIVPTLDVVRVEVLPDGKLKIIIDAHEGPTPGLVHS